MILDQVIIRKVDLPVTIKGITVLDCNGDYNIYLNDRLSSDVQAIAFRHEVEHIKLGHFYSEEDLISLENKACMIV